MTNWPPELSKGNIIEADHFNQMLRRFKDFWIGDSYTFGFNHTEDPTVVSTWTDSDGNIVERSQTPYLRHGWGQPNILPAEVAIGQIITAEHINQLIAVINVAIFHIDKTDLPPYPKITFNYPTDKPYDTPTIGIATVDLSYYDEIMAIIDKLEKYKFDADNVSSNTDVALIETNQGFTWEEDLYCVFGASFNSYNDARHYFNSGGVITFELECGGAANGTVPNWEKFFNMIGEIRIAADESTTTGFLKNSIMNGGFYNIGFGNEWTTIFEIAASQFSNSEYGPGGEFAGEYAKDNENRSEYFGAYGRVIGTEYMAVYLGEYTSRRVRVQGRIVQTNQNFGENTSEYFSGGEYNLNSSYRIEFKVILIEDDEDDLLPIENTINVSIGYLDILDTPTVSDYDNIPGLEQYFTFKNNPSYKFLARTSPEVSIVEQWTSTDQESDDIIIYAVDYVEDGYVA